MKNTPALAELLYLIACHEKGRCDPRAFWGRRYRSSLARSLDIMALLTDLIGAEREMTDEEYTAIRCFLFGSVGSIFPDGGDIGALRAETERGRLTNGERDTVDLMERLLRKIRILLREKGRGGKQQIWYLLSAFHNLPKSFLDPHTHTVFDLGIRPIDAEEAIAYARAYMNVPCERGERPERGTK